jgi:hypothetical protein
MAVRYWPIEEPASIFLDERHRSLATDHCRWPTRCLQEGGQRAISSPIGSRAMPGAGVAPPWDPLIAAGREGRAHDAERIAAGVGSIAATDVRQAMPQPRRGQLGETNRYPLDERDGLSPSCDLTSSVKTAVPLRLVQAATVHGPSDGKVIGGLGQHRLTRPRRSRNWVRCSR